MDAPRSSSRSRRSYPNLHNLSLAPLTSTKYPFDAPAPGSPVDGQIQTPHTSYIAQKSAPTTPGILSRSGSRNGRRRKAKYAYEGYFRTSDGAVRDIGDIPKAKSTDAMMPGVSFADGMGGRHHQRKRTAPHIPIRVPLVRHHTSESNDEWFHRAGLAIAGETRDSKGQGWLVRRESSTSLVGQTDDYEQHPSHDERHMALLSGEHVPEAEFARLSRVGSRVQSRINSHMGSRAHSARNSRRGSRVSSRADLMTSAGLRTPGGRTSFEMDEDIFDEGGEVVEPDFVETDDESVGDEEEIARLARESGFGLGTWMDRLIGWTLFSVDEDDEESDEEDAASSVGMAESITEDDLKLRREVEARRKKLEREAIVAAAAVRSADPAHSSAEGAEASKAPSDEEGGGWSDAAWLFSVASKVIL